jgi:type IV pilus assembly protein PilB
MSAKRTTKTAGGSGDFVTAADAARELGVDRSTLRRWIRAGRVEGRKVGRHWQVRSSDLGKVIEVHDSCAGPDEAPSASRRRVLASALKKVEPAKGEQDRQLADMVSQLTALGGDDDSGVRRFLAMVLRQALNDRATDLHFEPMADMFAIRYRVDGSLYEMAPPPKELARPMADEIMRCAQLNPNVRHLSQDGRIRLMIDGREVDFRVNTVPTSHGTGTCMRILDRAASLVPIGGQGFEPEQRELYERVINSAQGLIVVTGPTGAGKTTTIYGALREINKPDRKIMTAEEPIEFDIAGIEQLPIRSDAGFGFAEAARAMLRHGPNVLAIGELRDPRVAQIACEAALTGHLVFSTLHAADGAGAVTRMVDMGIPPFLVLDAVRCVVAQRLLRCICSECKTEAKCSASTRKAIGLGKDVGPVYRGKGCEKCHGLGYWGRTGVFELMEPTRSMQAAIASGDIDRVRELAGAQGCKSLRQVALSKALRGETTLEEVLKYT